MKYALFFIVLFLALGPAAGATSYLVLPDGSGDFPTIQAALDVASNGDEVVLGDGVFLGAGNRDLVCRYKAITIRSQSNSPEVCTIDCEASYSERHRGIVFTESSSATLLGITIRNGRTADPPYPDTAWDGAGAAVLCWDALPTIEHCVFLENRGAWGGAVAACRCTGPQISDCLFEDNQQGGVTIGGCDYPSLEHCIFRNSAVSSGGSEIEVRDCEFSDHDHIALSCSHYTPSASYTVAGCRFHDNRGTPLQASGGATGAISNCTFLNNVSNFGGAMVLDGGFVGTVSHCLMYGNSVTGRGGAVDCWRATVVFSNCTIAFNSAAGGAAGIDCGIGAVTIEHTIIVFSSIGSAVSGNATLACADLFGNAGGDWGGDIAPQYGVNGNLSADPLFCDGEAGDFRLERDSPCAPGADTDCGLIGALPVGCGSTPTRVVSWGRAKSLFK